MIFKRALRCTLALAFGVCTAALAKPASALEPAVTENHPQALGGLRFGTNDLNLGLGLRGGYTLHSNVYVGGLFDYFLGTSKTFNDGVADVETSATLWTMMAEGGYDLGVMPQLVVRPLVGVGFGHAHAQICNRSPGIPEDCFSEGKSKLAMALGGLLNYVIGYKSVDLVVGGDMRVLKVQHTHAIFGAHAGAMF